SQADAASASPGGGRGPGARDGVFDQQSLLERRQRGRSVSLPVADRSVLQTNQADSAVVRFPGQQRQRGPVAGLDGAIALRPDAFSVRDEQLEPLFYKALHAATSRALEKN